MSRKKRHFILIAIVLAGVLSVGCIFTIHSLRGRREAINAAEEYLREKYLTQMTILSAKYKYRNAHGLINEYYYVSASPVDAPEIVFQVVIDAVSGAPVVKVADTRSLIITSKYVSALIWRESLALL